LEGVRVNERDENEGIWMMGFIYIRETTVKPLVIVSSRTKRGLQR
jgi:hypothetical protein